MSIKKCPFSCCVVLPLETLPLGDPSGGVFYLRIVLSTEEPCGPLQACNGTALPRTSSEAKSATDEADRTLLTRWRRTCPEHATPAVKANTKTNSI